MNEASGGKQDLPNTTNTTVWDVMSSQSMSPVAGTMHHHHNLHHHHHPSMMQQDPGSNVSQVIVPTPVKLQPQQIPQTQNIVDHCSPLSHLQQPMPINQVIFSC